MWRVTSARGPRHRIIAFKHVGEPMMERLSGAELIMLDGVGHVPTVDRPDEVTRLILEVTGGVDGAADGAFDGGTTRLTLGHTAQTEKTTPLGTS